MSALRAKTTSLLLDRIPEQDRVAFVRDVTRSLDDSSSNADIGLAAALWRLVPDPETRSGLVSHLRQMVEQNDSDRVAAICKDHSELEHELLLNAIPRIEDATSLLQRNARLSIVVPVMESAQTSADEHIEESTINTATEQTKQLLGFLNRVISRSIQPVQAIPLLRSCLVLVGAADKALSQVAREALFSLIALPHTLALTDQETIWKRIESLVTFEDTYYKSLGFSLWLRWLLEQPVESSILQSPTYWDLVVDGLRRGDSERRKSALQILRASINASLVDSSLTSLMVADSQASTPRK